MVGAFQYVQNRSAEISTHKLTLGLKLRVLRVQPFVRLQNDQPAGWWSDFDSIFSRVRDVMKIKTNVWVVLSVTLFCVD